jgi:hypothetical protein
VDESSGVGYRSADGRLGVWDNGGGMGSSRGSGRWAVELDGQWIANVDTLPIAKQRAVDELAAVATDLPVCTCPRTPAEAPTEGWRRYQLIGEARRKPSTTHYPDCPLRVSENELTARAYEQAAEAATDPAVREVFLRGAAEERAKPESDDNEVTRCI